MLISGIVYIQFIPESVKLEEKVGQKVASYQLKRVGGGFCVAKLVICFYLNVGKKELNQKEIVFER